MKKLIAILLLACMVLAMTACGTPEAEYKLGMGVVLDMDSSDAGNAQVDATVATVVLDANGKIVACRLDCAQSKMDVTDGNVDAAKTFQSKRELKEDYGMVAYSNATLEWYQQAENFEKYAEGKTIEEIKNTATTTSEHGYTVAADETLYASCSIDISDFIEAIVKAGTDSKGQTFKASGEFTLGLAAITTADESVAATADEDGVVKMYTDFGATVVDKDGKIISAITDAVQPQITVNTDGEIVECAYKGTKRELGPDYGMVAYGSAIAEWDAQAQAFADFTVGKTAAEVRALQTVENDHGYLVAADETLYASCTMQITGMQAVLAQAVDYAR